MNVESVPVQEGGKKKTKGFLVVSFTSFSFPSFSEGVFFQSLTRHQEESPKCWRWSEELTTDEYASSNDAMIYTQFLIFMQFLHPQKLLLLTDGGSELTTTPSPRMSSLT
jgi:hypothetical protein